MNAKNGYSNAESQIIEYTNIIRENKKVLLIEKNREKLDMLIEDILDRIYNKKKRKLYVMELNFENSIKLGELKKNVKDFLGNRSIFANYPKMLLVRNLDLANHNIEDVYSKVVYMNNDVLFLASSTSLHNISKSVISNSKIIWNLSEERDISKEEFYYWLNHIDSTVPEDRVLKYINTMLLDYEDHFDELEKFNEIVDSKTSVFRDECLKLMLKISCEVN